MTTPAPFACGKRHVLSDWRMQLSTAGLCIVDDLVFGHAFRAAEQGREAQATADDPRGRAAVMHEIVDFMSGHLASGQFPELRAAIGDSDPHEFVVKMATAADADAWFEVGLEALLDGLAARFKL